MTRFALFVMVAAAFAAEVEVIIPGRESNENDTEVNSLSSAGAAEIAGLTPNATEFNSTDTNKTAANSDSAASRVTDKVIQNLYYFSVTLNIFLAVVVIVCCLASVRCKRIPVEGDGLDKKENRRTALHRRQTPCCTSSVYCECALC
jgi:hypothetical protein